MEKSNHTPWDVTRLRPIPPLQFYHHINEKNISIAKKRKFLLNILIAYNCVLFVKKLSLYECYIVYYNAL